MSINKNFWIALIFVLSGVVLGGLLGEIAAKNSFLWFLAYGQPFGTAEPLILDVGLLKITFGVMFKLNVASIIGVFVSMLVYRGFVK